MAEFVAVSTKKPDILVLPYKKLQYNSNIVSRL